MDASTLQVPKPLLWPVFILAALAAIIASQALISGVQSLQAGCGSQSNLNVSKWQFCLSWTSEFAALVVWGVFTIMSQAHALGLMPRILILHTNPDEKGQAGAESNTSRPVGCQVITSYWKPYKMRQQFVFLCDWYMGVSKNRGKSPKMDGL